MQEALRALVRFYRTGEDKDRRAYDIAWLADKDSPVDTINGFIEVYLDARGAKGAWEGIVFHVNAAKTDACARIAAHAQWFEDHMPYAPEYRRPAGAGRDGAGHRRHRRSRRRRPHDADRHQPSQR